MGQGTVITVQGGGQGLVRGLKRQSSVVLAIIFKEIKVRSRTSKFGLMFVLIEPIIYIIAITMIRWLIRGREDVDGLHVLVWIPLGVAAYLIFMRAVAKIPTAIASNQGLLDYPQVKPIDPLVGVFILEMILTMVGSCLAIFLIWWFFDQFPSLPRPLEAIGVIMALLAGCLGLALILGVYATFYENIPRIMKFVNRPMIFLSDVIIPISMLPAAIREYLAWNPLLQFIQHFRLYAAGQRTIPEADLAYACLCSALALGVGIIAYYANRYRLVQSR
ncbi:MAG TPA: ABC transporter permease [Aestuariivirgaceae bacterium]|nr:ABC transporter permease [Aestuariivirgaceae bacterium]